MAMLSDRDLFNFDQYFANLKALEGDTVGVAQAIVLWVDRIRASYDSAQKEAHSLQAEIAGISSAQKAAGSILADYDRKLDEVGAGLMAARNAEKSLNEARQLNNQVVVELTQKLLSLKQRYDSLDPSAKDYQKQQRAILTETKSVTRAIDAQSKSLQLDKSVIDAAEGSNNRLKKQTAELKRTLDAMPHAYEEGTGAINKQNKAAVALNEQYQKNIALLSKVEQGQRVFGRNVGNYPQGQPAAPTSALSMAGGLAGKAAGAGLALAGLDSVFTAIDKIGEITLQFDSLDSALKVVSNDTALFTQRQAMLKQISEDLGQDLGVIEKNYTNITASSLGTKLQGEATDKIFTQIVGTLGRLKRPSEEVDRALLAVGQMMSKGTVASEELKGQLGEVLPGSFSIAARSIGVTTSKLSDMLKSGEVIASEFLPKFAAELEKTFNPNNERRVEGLAANLARLRNEGVEWVKSLNIGDEAGAFIGNITSMARSVREFLAPAVATSTSRLAEQTEAVRRLESQLPALLTRYDELKSKTKLSADEQKELQTVINSLVNLAPSAATGFDAYGNALDVNKEKVLAFTLAQQDLNDSLKKTALKALNDQTTGAMQRVAQTQAALNRGTKQQSFSLTPYFMMTDEEKRQATDKNAGKRREVAQTDDDKRNLQSQLQKENKQIEQSILQRLQLGDQLTEADEKFIAGSKSDKLKQTKLIKEYNDQISMLTSQQAGLLSVGDKKSLKEREGVLKELEAYKAKRKAIIDPTLPGEMPAGGEDNPGAEKAAKKAEAARKKAQTEADRRLREALSVSKAGSGEQLAKNSSDKQDGVISEQEFIDKRKAITLAGIKQRQDILAKAGKKESDDFKNLQKEKIEAETAYSRDSMKLELTTSKKTTAEAIAELDNQKAQGLISELDYIEKKNAIAIGGADDQLRILERYGLSESQLAKDVNQQKVKIDKDYYQERLKANEAAWKKELTQTEEALKAVDQKSGESLTEQLNKLELTYQKEEQKIKVAVAKRSMTEEEGEAKIYALKQKYLSDSMAAVESSYQQEEKLAKTLTEEKIRQLEDWKTAAIRTPAEILAVEAEIALQRAKLEGFITKERKKSIQEVHDFAVKAGDSQSDHEVKVTETAEQKRQKLWQGSLEFAASIGDSLSNILQSGGQRDMDQLDKQHDRELSLVGDNADAKARIDEQYNKRKAEIQRKAAIQEREAALFSIAISTAQAVMSVLSTGGGAHYLDFGVSAGILSAFVTAAGALQAAAVLAAPLPTFWTGTSAAPEGLAHLAERGPELRQKRDGSYQYYDKPTVDYLAAGDRIYTASQTAKIVEDWQRDETARQALQEAALIRGSMGKLQEGRQNELRIIHAPGNSMTPQQFEDAVGRALDKRPSRTTIVDADGQHEYYQELNSRTEYLNRRHSLPR